MPSSGTMNFRHDTTDVTQLIWADWLDENGREREAADTRLDALDPVTESEWHREYRFHVGVGVGVDGVGVGGVGVGGVGGGGGVGVGGSVGGVGGVSGVGYVGGVY